MSYVDEVESIVDETARWAVDTINMIVEILMPDGRGFNEEPKSEQERLDEYLKVRGNPDSWTEWLNDVESNIIQQLISRNVPPEEVQLVNPRGIASSMAIKWSADMEKVIHD